MMLKRILTLSALVLVTLPGCDGGASNPQQQSPIVGVWRVRSLSDRGGGAQDCPAVTPLITCTTANERFIFHANGSMVDPNGSVRQYTYAAPNLTYFGLPQGTTIVVSAQGSTMQWDITNGANFASVLLERQ